MISQRPCNSPFGACAFLLGDRRAPLATAGCPPRATSREPGSGLGGKSHRLKLSARVRACRRSVVGPDGFGSRAAAAARRGGAM